MPDKQSELSIIIEAVNNASKQLKDVEKDLGGLSKSVQEQGETAKTASLGFGQLVAGVAGGAIAAQLAIGAFQKLAGVLIDIPKAIFDIAKGASEIEGLAVAMHIVANNAGITAEAVDKVRDSVVEQNVTTQAANRLLTDLIRNQLDYAQATDIASAAQNIAVASGVDSSETIERISQALASGNTWLLRQLGLVEHLDSVYEKYGVTLGKTSEEMTESERKQSIVNYVLAEGEKYAGAYGAAMNNAAKIMRSTKARMEEVKYAVGSELTPALDYVTKTIYEMVSAVVDWAHENKDKLRAVARDIGNFMKRVVDTVKVFIESIPWDYVITAFNFVIQKVAAFGAGLRMTFNVIQVFTRAITTAVSTVIMLGSAVDRFIKRDFKGMKNVFNEWSDKSYKTGQAIIGDINDIGNAYNKGYKAQEFDLKEWWDSVEELEGTGWEDRLKVAEEGGEKLTAKQKEKLDKMLEQIEKANRDYQRAVEKRTKQFEESFEDLVLSHRDTIKKLTDDLESENKDYQKNIKDLLDDYSEAMEEIEVRHRDKTESVMEDMEDERKKIEEEIDKITEKYNEERVLIEREGEARLNNLKVQLDREVALGVNANQEKIEALEQMIAYEESGLSNALDDKKSKYDEEVSDIEEKLSEKLTKLKEELDEEDILFTEAMDKRELQYERDLIEFKESYEEKRQVIQEELDSELSIREKYAGDFERLADKVAEDDLTRLIRKHNEELSEMERDHIEKLAGIESNSFEQGKSFSENLSDGIEAGYPAVKASIGKIEDDLNSLGKVYEDFETKASWMQGFPSWQPMGFTTGGGGSGGGSGGAWQQGGLAMQPGLVGEAGPEIVLPLSFPKRMAQIMQSLGMSGGKSEVVQNFYVTVQSQQDVDVLMERAGFALKQGGY